METQPADRSTHSRSEFLAALREILNRTNRGLTRALFWREISRTLVRFTRSDGVVLRLEDGDLYFRWTARPRAREPFDLRMLARAERAPGLADLRDTRGETLLDALSLLLLSRGTRGRSSGSCSCSRVRRPQKNRPLNTGVVAATSFLESRCAKEGIALEVRLEDGLPTLYADDAELGNGRGLAFPWCTASSTRTGERSR